MKRKIYGGEDYGFFGQTIFQQQLRDIFCNLEGVCSRPGRGIPYHFSYVSYDHDHNVAISHQGFSVRTSSVVLFGSSRNIREVNEIIWRAYQKYEESHPWAKVS